MGLFDELQDDGAAAPKRNGLLSFLEGAGGDMLSDIGYGLLSAPNWKQGFAAGGRRSIDMQPYRQQLAEQQKEKTLAEASQNQTIAYLEKMGRTDLAEMVWLRTMSPADAAKAAYSEQKAATTPKTPSYTEVNGKLVRTDTDAPYVAYDGGPSTDDVRADGKEAFDRESALWKEYSNSDPIKTYEAVKGGYQRIMEGAQLDSGAGDMSIIYGFMKMNDPGSVVRESEFQMAAQSGSLGEQIQGFVNQILTGGRLAPGVRQRMVEAARGLYGQSAEDVEAFNQQFTTRATASGVDPLHILRSPEEFDPFTVVDSRAEDPLDIR
jgi:hypothetical protein